MKKRILSLLLAMVMLLALVPAALADEVTGTGTAQGFGGDVTVTVTLNDGVITAVEATGDSETDGIGKNVITEWPDAFVQYNGIVDTYTGATFAGVTRAAFIEAARAALTEAGVNPDDYLREMEVTAEEDLETAIPLSPEDVTIDAVMELEGLQPLSKEVSTLFVLDCHDLYPVYETPKVAKYEISCRSGKLEAVLYKRKKISVTPSSRTLFGHLGINRWRSRVSCQFEIEKAE